jgi:PAS domain S-box-containing protein
MPARQSLDEIRLTSHDETSAVETIFGGPGEIRAFCRAFDWSATALGPVEQWPQSLRTVVQIVLSSKLPMAIAWWPGMNIIYNEDYRDFLGTRHPDALGQPASIVFPEHREIAAQVHRRMRNGESVSLENASLQLVRSTGAVEQSVFCITYTPVRGESGAVSGALCTIVETAQRKPVEPRRTSGLRIRVVPNPAQEVHDADRADDHLRESEERVRLALAFGDLKTWTWDIRAGRVLWADEHYAMHGYRIGEIEPSYVAWLARVHPDDRAHAESCLIESRDLRRPYAVDYRSLHPDGTIRWLSAQGHFVYDEHGAAIRLIGVVRDVTDRARTEIALRETGERLKLAAAATGLGFFDWDLASDEVAVDSHFREMLLIPARAELSGSGLMREVVHPDDRAFVKARLADAFEPKSDGSYHFEHRTTTPDGERWMFTFGQVKFTGEGADRQPARVLGNVLDITARKYAERVLRTNEERQAFLLQLSDALRTLTDPDAIESEACRLVGEQLHVDRATYAEVDEATGDVTVHRNFVRGLVPSVIEHIPLAEYTWIVPPLRQGQTVVINDVATTSHIPEPARDSLLSRGVGSAIAVPLLKDRETYAVLTVMDNVPRAWAQDEVDLVREVAERTWAAVERARAEAALRESEQKYRSLFNSMDEGYGIAHVERDATGRPYGVYWLEANRQFERLTGLAAAEQESGERRVRELDDVWLEAYRRVSQGRESVRFEHYRQTLDRWYEVRAFARGPDRVAVLYDDITLRKATEDVVRASEAHNAFLLVLSDRLRALGDPMEIQLAATRLLTEYLGVPRCYYAEFCEDEDIATIRCEHVTGDAPSMKGIYRMSDFSDVLDRLQTGRPYVAQASLLREPAPMWRSQNRVRQLHAQITIPLIKNGKLVATLTVSDTASRKWTPLDVSIVQETGERTWAALERAHAEDALRESVERMRRAAAAARLFAWDMDLLTGQLRVSTEAQSIAGHEMPSNFRTENGMVFHADDSERVWAEFDAAIARGGDFEIEYRRPDMEGLPVRWLRSTGTVIKDGTGTPIRAVGVTQDITTRKLAEAALSASELRARTLLAEATKARAEAEAANRAKDEFLATLSHELRTPLAAILLWAGALRSGAVPLNELERAIDAIAQSAESQSRLIEDLLDLSRLTQGKLLLVRSAVDVTAVAQAAIEIVRPVIRAKRILFTSEIQDDLGLVLLDGSRFKQVLWNLLTNAMKFTPEGGAVKLGMHTADSLLEIEIADTGEGIAPEFMPHLFKKFSQADMGETRRHMGLGIGLALTKQLVELHGGTVEAESEGRGRGSVFRVRLPWVKPDCDQASEPSRGSIVAQSSLPLERVRVLVVEDDANTREALRWMLARAGAHAIAVGTADDALEAFEAPIAPDVIVSDLGLPGMSGYELIERVAAECKKLGRKPPPSCAVSAHAREIDRQRAIEAGFDVYVAKPVTAEELVEAVTDLRDILAARSDD